MAWEKISSTQQPSEILFTGRNWFARSNIWILRKSTNSLTFSFSIIKIESMNVFSFCKHPDFLMLLKTHFNILDLSFKHNSSSLASHFYFVHLFWWLRYWWISWKTTCTVTGPIRCPPPKHICIGFCYRLCKIYRTFFLKFVIKFKGLKYFGSLMIHFAAMAWSKFMALGNAYSIQAEVWL